METASSKRQYNKFHLESKCRICLTKSLNDMTDLSSPLNKFSPELLIYKVLEYVVGEEIPLENKYPGKLCGICISLLGIAYDLKMEYFKSKNKLLESTLLNKCNLDQGATEIVKSQPHKENVCEDSQIDIIKLETCEYFENNENVMDADTENENQETVSIASDYLKTEKNDDNEESSFKNQYSVKVIKESEVLFDKIVSNSKTREITSTYLCSHCNRSFDNGNYFRKHTTVCKNLKNMECYVCNKKFKRKRYLYAHITNSHLSNKNMELEGQNMPDPDLQCKLCNKWCTNKKTLAYHHQSSHKVKEFSCDKCGKMFAVQSQLAKHQQIHQKETKVVCPVCGKGFHYDTGLFYHMKMHNNERRYKCHHCPRDFYTLSGLKRHERTHTGERPYNCRYCVKCFRSSGERKNHEYIHTGERPHKCKICFVGFTKPYNLNIHLMAHEGDETCHMCDRGFVNQQILLYHLRIHHGVKPIKNTTQDDDSSGNTEDSGKKK